MHCGLHCANIVSNSAVDGTNIVVDGAGIVSNSTVAGKDIVDSVHCEGQGKNGISKFWPLAYPEAPKTLLKRLC